MCLCGGLRGCVLTRQCCVCVDLGVCGCEAAMAVLLGVGEGWWGALFGSDGT